MSPETVAGRRRGSANHMHPAVAGDVSEEFAEFAEACRRFARVVTDRLGTPAAGNPAELAERNVRLVRTVFSKWNLEILSSLYGLHEAGFEELRRCLRGISARVLSQKLSFLQERGLVGRIVLASTPVRVRYTLTEAGLTVARLGEPVMLYLHFASTRAVGLPPPSSPTSAR